jgi:hypothetical protein
MSEETTPLTEENNPTETTEGGSDFKPITSQEDLDRLVGSRLKREREKYSDYNDLKTKAAEYDKQQEAAKSELQRLQERAEQAESKLSVYEQKEQIKAWAKEIVKGSDVPADVLRGSTKEELEEHFEQLKPAYTKDTAPKVPGDGKQPKNKPASGDWLREAIS